MRSCFAASVLLSLLAAAPALAETCPRPIKPGLSIGPVKLGMTAEQAREFLNFVAPKAGEPPVWRLSGEPGFSFRVGKGGKIEEISLVTGKPCLVDGRERILDLSSRELINHPPLPDCGGKVTASKTGWICSTHGIDFLWDGPRTSVVVRRGEPMAPYLQAPPPLPRPPKGKARQKVDWTPPPIAGSENVAEGGAGPDAAPVAVAAAGAIPDAPPDPCLGNWAPMPNMACGFFGRGDALAVECYPTALCMGTFASNAPEHIDIHGANGEPLGPFSLHRGGRTLAWRFGKAPAVGTQVRVYIDRHVRVIVPATANMGANPPTDPRKDPRVVGIEVSGMVGGRRLANGFVIDLQVPPSAAPNRAPAAPAATLEKKVSRPN